MKGHGGSGDILEDVSKATEIVKMWTDPTTSPAAVVPKEVLKHCKGLVFVHFVKIGALISGSVGSGFVIAKLPDGSWSGPAVVTVSGVGFGAQVGGEMVHNVFTLNSEKAVKQFYDPAPSAPASSIAKLPDGSWSGPAVVTVSGVGFGAQVGGEMVHNVFTLNSEKAVKQFYDQAKFKIGTDIDAAAGPVGFRLEKSDDINNIMSSNPMSAYSYSKGASIGVSVEGTVLAGNPPVNDELYKKHVDAEKILTGAEVETAKSHAQIAELYAELDKASA
eukprot:CAMPEP_0174913758 /NCGR_PEP_ID=MMETSP0167-20121228/80485_1 /TAXON_ID=38298 /ORGANISM="Rhodella maculata, Strain CCMP736" /LENGTH=275 /DNA_ID=CAMNT_0016158493 /DNA_START=297 /DNA_END=1123 /DNA_ORIENTATION=+